MSEQLNPKFLRAFLAVARLKSVKRAAESLHRTQSAVTRSIQQLEASVEASLFERHAHGMMLTDAGRILMERAERSFAEMRAAATAFATDLGQACWVEQAPIFTLSVTRQRLLAFVELSAQHTMASVATSLGISQPAVSQALHEIETGLGLKLFRRTPTSMVPTAHGALLALHVKRALAELRIAQDELRSRSGTVQGSVVVGTLSLGRTRLLPLAITRVLRNFSSLTVRTEEASFEQLATLLREGEIDFILGALRGPEHTKGFVRRIVTSDLLGIVVRAGHPLAAKAGVALADVLTADWVLPRKGTSTRELLEATLQARGMPPPNVRVETADLAVTLGTLMSSDIVTAVSPHLFRGEIGYRDVHVLEIDLPETRRDVGILQRVNGIPSLAARLIIEAMVDIGEL